MAVSLGIAIISRKEAWVYHRSMAAPGLTYSLPAGTLTKDQCKSVQAPLIMALLPALGYNSNMPCKLVHGPTSIGRLGIAHLFAKQGSQKIRTILHHLQTNSTLGQVIRICLA